MDVNVKIKGTEETINKIRVFGSRAFSELEQKMLEVVADFVDDAKEFAPFVTGYLKNHITGKIIKVSRGIVVIGRIHSRAKYSFFQEYGTIRHAAHPFMRPAFNKNKMQIIEKFGRAIHDAIMQSEYKGKLVERLM